MTEFSFFKLKSMLCAKWVKEHFLSYWLRLRFCISQDMKQTNLFTPLAPAILRWKDLQTSGMFNRSSDILLFLSQYIFLLPFNFGCLCFSYIVATTPTLSTYTLSLPRWFQKNLEKYRNVYSVSQKRIQLFAMY
jgi:hypothetical protein